MLFAGFGSLGANSVQPTQREVQPTAAFTFTRLLPWVVAPSPSTSSRGVVAASALLSDTAAAANAALTTANQLGPLTLNLTSLRSLSANQPPPGSTAGTANYTQMDQWLSGIPGIATSTGALGFAENAVSYDPFVGTHAGVLQTNNTLGPLYFNLNVLKAIGFTQAPTGQVLMNGQPDNFSAVDIGRWTGGLPGVFSSSGTTGFVTYQDFGNGPISDFRVGGLHTTTTVGPMAFDFNFLPFVSTGIIPPSLSFGLAPDMTAANTPFAPFTPPPPGVIQPFGGLPVPAAAAPVFPLPAPLVAPAPAPAPAAPFAAPEPAPSAELADAVEAPSSQRIADETASPTTPSVVAVKPTPVVIPGVNGAPPVKPSTPGTSGAGGGSPFAPLKPFTDAITNGIGSITGFRPPTAGGAGTTSGAGTGAGPGEGSEPGGDKGSSGG